MNKQINKMKLFSTFTVYLLILVIGAAAIFASEAPVNLGTANNFTILTQTGISTVGSTLISGNIGTYPFNSGSMSGFSQIVDSSNQFATSSFITGKMYGAEYSSPTPTMLNTAKSDFDAAYLNASQRGSGNITINLGGGNISGLTLSPGVYFWIPNVIVTSDVTLSGNSSDVWILQLNQNLDVASGKKIILTGGAQAKNVFWQISGQATLGNASDFSGIMLVQGLIKINNSAVLHGKALSKANVVLDSATISLPASNTSNSSNVTPIVIPTFFVNITSPTNTSQYNSTTISVQIDSNVTLDNITTIFDGTNETLLCANCSTYSGLYPNTWDGAHSFTVMGMLSGTNQTTIRTFSINTSVSNITNQTNTTNQTNITTPTNVTFAMLVSSPVDSAQYNTTTITLQIDANVTLDNITAIFDGANETLLCANCSTFSGLYPYNLTGGHSFTIFGTLNGTNVSVNRTFSINVDNSTFTLDINSPVEGTVYTSATVPMQIISNTTNDNITAMFDGANETLLCSNCSSYNATYPNGTDGTHSFTVFAMLNGTTRNVTRTFSINTAVAASGGSGGGGGGSGSGFGGSSGSPLMTNTRSSSFQQMLAGSYNITFTNSGLAITGLNITTIQNTTNVVFTITQLLNGLPSGVLTLQNAKIYSYLQVNHTNLDNSQIGSVMIQFKVPKTWMSNNNVDPSQMRLYRLTSNWDVLSTTLVSQDGNYYYFQANSQGLSYFAIASTQTAPAATTTGNTGTTGSPTTTTGSNSVTPVSGANGATTSTTDTTTNTNGFPWIWVIGGLVLIAIVAMIIAVGTGSTRRRTIVVPMVPVVSAASVKKNNSPISPFGDVHPVIDIEGVGPQYSHRLVAMGIKNTKQLWEANALNVANTIRVPVHTVKSWQRMAELISVNGIGPQYAELLERSGIHSIAQLKAETPTKLLAMVRKKQDTLKTNIQGNHLGQATVSQWIEEAKAHKGNLAAENEA